MVTELNAVIDENGELRAQVPKGTQPGDRKILLLPPSSEQPTNAGDNERPWTESEIKQMLVAHPKTGAEIAQSDAIGGWAHMGITDSVAFVEELRRKRKERQWSRD